MKEITAWMIKNVITVGPEQAVLDACNLMQKNNIGSVIVLDNNKPVGIFTERDLVVKVVAAGKTADQTKMREVMSTEIKTATTSSSYKDVYDLMRANNIRHLPIIENDAMVGIVSIKDLLRFHMRTMEQTITDLTNELHFAKSILDKTGDERSRELLLENKRLKDLAIVDSLTGLYNYRFFEETFAKEIARAKRYNHMVSLLFIDIDYFKHYNDINGHEQGNILLKQLANIFMTTSRHTDTLCKVLGIDIVARYGGEEFVIILPETPKKGALVRAKRLLDDVRNYPFHNREAQPSGRLTISIGVAEFPNDADTWEELIKKADESLYQAKNAGRDRVA